MQTVAVPPIPISALTDEARDYLLIKANHHGCSPADAVKMILDEEAADHLPPRPISPPATQPQPAEVAA